MKSKEEIYQLGCDYANSAKLPSCDYQCEELEKAFIEGYSSSQNRYLLILGAETPHPITDILPYLIKATEKLLHDKGYDGYDYEEMEVSVSAAKVILSKLIPTK